MEKRKLQEEELQNKIIIQRNEVINASLDKACYRITANLLRYRDLSWTDLESKVDDLLLEAINIGRELDVPQKIYDRYLSKTPLDAYNKGEFLRNLAHGILHIQPDHSFLRKLIQLAQTL